MNNQKISLVLFLMVLSGVILAQPGNPDTPVPFGAIEILAISGLAYGAIRKMKSK